MCDGLLWSLLWLSSSSSSLFSMAQISNADHPSWIKLWIISLQKEIAQHSIILIIRSRYIDLFFQSINYVCHIVFVSLVKIELSFSGHIVVINKSINVPKRSIMTQNSIESSSGMGVVVNSNVNVNNDNHNHSTIMTTMVTTDNNNVNPPIAAPIPTSSASTTATTCTPMATTNVRRIRRYRIFPGRNRFFCDGRIIMAKQISVFYFTVALLVGTCVCFFIFE